MRENVTVPFSFATFQIENGIAPISVLLGADRRTLSVISLLIMVHVFRPENGVKSDSIVVPREVIQVLVATEATGEGINFQCCTTT